MQKDPLTEYYKKSTSYADHLAGKDDSLFGYYKNAVCQFSNRNDKILDLGCGTGQSSYLISLEERNTVGLDISMFLLNKLNFRNPGYLDYVNGDILNLPFKRNSFDVVSAYAVLEHLLDVEKALEEMIRVLKPGGNVVLIGPNMISPFRSLNYFLIRLRGKRKEFHIDGTPRAILRSVYRSVRKKFSNRYQFEYRTPFLRGLKRQGVDYDAVHLSNPFDLQRYFRTRNFRIKKLAYSEDLIGKMIAFLFPRFAGGICFIAEKSNEN